MKSHNLKDSPFYGPISEKYSLTERTRVTSVCQIWRGTKINDDSKTEISIKRTKLFNDDHSFPPAVFRELVLLSEINYPHIIRPIHNEISCDLEEGMISFSFESHLIDLRKVVRFYSKKNEVIPHVATKSILFQLLLALDYLHSRSIAHCNVIPTSMLLMKETERIPGIMKLADLGYSRIIDEQNTQKSLSFACPWYCAPEIMLGDTNYDTSIDIWACGCVFAELLTGNVVFGPTSKEFKKEFNALNSCITQLLNIVNILGPINDADCAHPMLCSNMQHLRTKQPIQAINPLSKLVNTTAEAFDLLSKMLIYNSKKRITAKEALKHPYFSQQPICQTNIVAIFPKKEWEEMMQTQIHPQVAPQTTVPIV